MKKTYTSKKQAKFNTKAKRKQKAPEGQFKGLASTYTSGVDCDIVTITSPEKQADLRSIKAMFTGSSATYVKQANIAHGAQQVNNGTAPQQFRDQYAHTHAPAKEIENPQNKLLEATHAQQSYRMDTRAPQKAKRSHQAVEAVESVHRR